MTSASFSRILFLMSRSIIGSASEGFLGKYRQEGWEIRDEGGMRGGERDEGGTKEGGRDGRREEGRKDKGGREGGRERCMQREDIWKRKK